VATTENAEHPTTALARSVGRESSAKPVYVCLDVFMGRVWKPWSVHVKQIGPVATAKFPYALGVTMVIVCPLAYACVTMVGKDPTVLSAYL